MKKKFTATMLALFLGGIGMHKFYLDRSKTGLLYLLFCWTLIPIAISLFDFLGLVFMSKEKFDAKYNGFKIDKSNSNSPGTSNTREYALKELDRLAELRDKNLISFTDYTSQREILLKSI